MADNEFDFDELKKSLYTAVLSDVMDSMGFRDQAMKPFIRPLDDTSVLFGRARTGFFMNTYSVAEGENPYEHEIALIDGLRPHDIAVLGCDGPTTRIAPWGELLSTACIHRGAAGCVTDGLVRDVRHIRKLQFPVFHGGIGPLDSQGRGKMMNYDLPIECGGVTVRSGDLVFGDVDGVVVIPLDIAGDVLRKSLDKVQSENDTRDELSKGLLLRDVYEKYGVL